MLLGRNSAHVLPHLIARGRDILPFVCEGENLGNWYVDSSRFFPICLFPLVIAVINNNHEYNCLQVFQVFLASH